MYKKLELNECIRLLNTGAVVLLCAQCEAGKTITPVAWNMPVNDEPPVAAVALDGSHLLQSLYLKAKNSAFAFRIWKCWTWCLNAEAFPEKKKTNFQCFP